MEVKAGYKQTEVGIIPEDWKVVLLGQIADIRSGGTPSTLQPQFWDGDIPWCTPTDVTGLEGHKFLGETGRKITFYGLKNSSAEIIPPGSVLMTSRATIGECAINRVPVSTNQGFKNFVPFVNINVDFLYYLLQMQKQAFISLCGGSTFLEIGKRQLAVFQVSFPPTRSEQEAIAGALNDADELIEALGQLLDKKRQIKQGAMQELLTGKSRLPGFGDAWETRILGNVSQIKTGKRNNEDKTDDGIYPFFVRSQTVERIKSYSFDGEAILVPGEGGIGSIVHYINGKFDYHQRVYKISNFLDDICGIFVYYVMVHSFNHQAMRNSVKATVDSLRLPTFQEFEFVSPQSLNEQKAIAEILTDIDLEIAILESKLVKTRDVKQGMMQELLTGRIRLNE